MNSREIKKCNSIPMLRDRMRVIQSVVCASNKREGVLRNEAVRIACRLVQLGC
jgi:hypothetical protein